MKGDELQAFAAWRRKAEEDYASAALLLEYSGPPATTCFLSHQVAEKYLKAYLVLNSRPLKRIHHLDALLEDCLRLDEGFARWSMTSPS